jgi:hypothetical protein
MQVNNNHADILNQIQALAAYISRRRAEKDQHTCRPAIDWPEVDPPTYEHDPFETPENQDIYDDLDRAYEARFDYLPREL